MSSAFIIGGTGQIGIATAAELLRLGWNVRLGYTGTRDAQNVPLGADLVPVDRRDTGALLAAIGTTDLLIDTMAFSGRDADQLVSLAAQYGQLCVISSASVYEDEHGRSLETAGTIGFPEYPVPIPETQRTVAAGPQSYSSSKVELEQRLLETSSRPVSILRPCAVHGINSKHPREWWLLKRMLDGRRYIPLAGDGDSVFHTSATANIAALVRTIAGRIDGHYILNAADPTAPTLRAIGETLAALVGWSGEFIGTPADSAIGQTPFSTPHPIVVSMAAAESIGYLPAGSYAETLVPYVEWMRSHARDWSDAFPMFKRYPADPFDYPAEDATLAI
jgi:nucleoside-diphosphate-sugar epimerase